MTGGRAPRLALAAAALAVSAAVAALSIPYLGVGRSLLLQAPALAFLGAGLAAWNARPGHSIGSRMMVIGLLAAAGAGVWQGQSTLAYTAGMLCANCGLALAAHIVVSFPSGRLTARAERWTLAYVYLLSFGLGPLAALFPHAAEHCARCAEHLGALDVGAWAASSRAYDVTAAALGIVAVGLVATLLVRRWRAATPPARRVMAPMLWAGLLGAVAVASGYLAVLAGRAPGPTSFAHAPAAAQTLVVLSRLALVAVPFGFLGALLRTRVTRTTIGQLAAELDRAPSGIELRDALARALGDPSLLVGYWAAELGCYVDPAGHPLDPARATGDRVHTAIEGDDEPLAVLIHDPAVSEDQGLVEAVADAARLALENERLDAEIRAQIAKAQESRARIVAVAEEERRRMEAELHGGVHQRLAGVGLTLRLLERRLQEQPSDQAATLLHRAQDEVTAAAAELRELARGVHPEALRREGLAGALRSVVDRSPVPVLVEGALARRFPDAVESCAYFVCSEALQNVAKYAQAQLAKVQLEADAEWLELTISDDGIGGAHLGAGSGLVGLRDRVEALGGTLAVSSRVGEGTVLIARLPLSASAMATGAAA